MKKTIKFLSIFVCISILFSAVALAVHAEPKRIQVRRCAECGVGTVDILPDKRVYVGLVEDTCGHVAIIEAEGVIENVNAFDVYEVYKVTIGREACDTCSYESEGTTYEDRVLVYCGRGYI